MYQLMLNRKNSRKGFTLVEVIVVLVILAILAAIMIPAMTGWIEKAQEKSAIVRARTAMLATQTLLSEKFGDSTVVVGTDEILALAELTGQGTPTWTKGDKNQLEAFSWADTKTGLTVTYNFTNNSWSSTVTGG